MPKPPVIDVNKSSLVVAEFLWAYAKGEANGGSVSWEDLDIVFERANEAAPGLYNKFLKEARKADKG
jgi:hypothetical protein